MFKIIIFIISCFFSLHSSATQKKTPRLSIITSLYNGDEHIEGFLKDVTSQTMYSECEFIIINANSPGNEEKMIKIYQKKYPNIIYKKLDKDPGIYAVWNMAIKMASSPFITNANLDDRSCTDSYEKHVQLLEKNPDVDLVYTDYLVTHTPNETMETNTHKWVAKVPEYSPDKMNKCLPGPRPVYRKSLLEKYGYFDDSYLILGDWELWARAASKGATYKKMEGIYTLYYLNPNGLSTTKEKEMLKNKEKRKVMLTYQHNWWKDQKKKD